MFLSSARRTHCLIGRGCFASASAAAINYAATRFMTTGGQSGIQTVAVIGAGTLGSQVAFQSAITGHDVTVLDVSGESLKACEDAHKQIAASYVARETDPELDQARSWTGLASPDKPAETVAEETLGRLKYTTDVKEALAGCQLVSENVPENPEIKSKTYAGLSEHAPNDTIFTTNSSTLLPSDFASVTGRPSQFLALHFANGIWDHNIGEVMPHPGTDPKVTEKVLAFAKDIRMVPFHLEHEQNGYIINSLLVPWLNASQSLVTNGIVSDPADVDRAWLISTGGFRAPKPGSVFGPFQIMDIIGIPLVSNVLSFWGERLNDHQMAKNGDYLKEKYVDLNKHGITIGNPLTDKAEGMYTYPNPKYLRDDFLD